MSTLGFVNIASWAPSQVANWLTGLDDILFPYVKCFVSENITGKRLLSLNHEDLRNMSVTKFGHQELILEAVDLLSALHYDLERETIQSVALILGCKARSLHNDLQAWLQAHLDGNRNELPKKLPVSVLSAVSDIVGSVKSLVPLLDRPPFDTCDKFVQTRNSLLKLVIEMVAAVPGENIYYSQEIIRTMCLTIASMCESIICESTDPLTIQPASVELATIRKKPDEELGMHIQSTYNGTHIIGRIKDESPADMCGKVEEGDEVIQVNYRTVVGWQLKFLVAALKDNQKEVTLTLKKRPRHASVFGSKAARKKHKHLKETNSTFPKAIRRMTKEGKTCRSPLTNLNFTPPSAEPLSDGARDNDSDIEDNGEVFQGTVATVSSLQVEVKPRRATVSGGSPTLNRPVPEISELDTPSVRPKSFTISSPSSTGSYSNLASPGSDVLSPRAKLVSSGGKDTEMGLLTKVRSPPPEPLSPDIQRKIEKKIQSVESPKRKKSIEQASKEIPGDVKGSPVLVRICRLDSNQRPIVTDDGEKDEYSSVSSTLPPLAEDRPASYSDSYMVNIVGGVPQKVSMKRDLSQVDNLEDITEADITTSPAPSGGLHSPTPSSRKFSILPKSPSMLLRKKNIGGRRLGAHRRISCKDLGAGECQGWLYKKREAPGLMHSKWVKRWFVLKCSTLYYYTSQEDLKADGVIYLPGFQISPAPEIKSKKFAFKAHHTGTTFYFASERQSDMGKWMNKMGLAAIVYDTSNIPTTAGFNQVEALHTPPLDRVRGKASSRAGADGPCYSESEDEIENGPSTPVHTPLHTPTGSPAHTPTHTPLHTPIHTPTPTPTHTPSPSTHSSREDLTDRDDLAKVYTTIKTANLLIDGSDFKIKRTTTLARAITPDLLLGRKIASLERTLKDKEQELTTIEQLFDAETITSEQLREFRAKNPQLLETGSGSVSSYSPSDGE